MRCSRKWSTAVYRNSRGPARRNGRTRRTSGTLLNALLELLDHLAAGDAQLIARAPHVAVRVQGDHKEVVRGEQAGDRDHALGADGDLAGLSHLQRLTRLPHLAEDAGVLDEQGLQLDALRRPRLDSLDGDAVEANHARGECHGAAAADAL